MQAKTKNKGKKWQKEHEESNVGKGEILISKKRRRMCREVAWQNHLVKN